MVGSRVTVLVNRNARGLRHPTPLLRALSPLDDCRLIETRTLQELDDAAQMLASERPELVVLAGGDGSVMAGLSAIVSAFGASLPRFAIVPAGTVSTIAKNLRLPRRPVPYARDLVDAALAGRARVVRHSTLRVKDAAGGERIGFIFGTGLVAQFFEVYDTEPDAGAAAAAKIVGKLFVGAFTKSALAQRVLTPMPIKLALDGEPLPHDRYSLVVSSTLRDVGLHLRPTFRAHDDAARVHVVASTRGPAMLAMQLPVVLAGTKLRGGGHVDALAASFRVDFDGELRSYVLDGDRIEAHANATDGEAWVTVERGPTIDLVVA